MGEGREAVLARDGDDAALLVLIDLNVAIDGRDDRDRLAHLPTTRF